MEKRSRVTTDKKEFFEVISEGRFIDYTIIFLIGRKLLRKIEDWPAFKLGLIDEDGKVIRKAKTPEEKDSLTLLDRFILKIRRLVSKNKWLLLTPLILLRESKEELEWSDVKAKDEKFLTEKVKRSEKVKKIILKLDEQIKEEGFEDEDEFWREFLKLKS